MWPLVLFLLLVILILAVYFFGKSYVKKMGPFACFYEDLSVFDTFKLGCVMIKLQFDNIIWTYEYNRCKLLILHLLRRLRFNVSSLWRKMKNKVFSWFW